MVTDAVIFLLFLRDCIWYFFYVFPRTSTMIRTGAEDTMLPHSARCVCGQRFVYVDHTLISVAANFLESSKSNGSPFSSQCYFAYSDELWIDERVLSTIIVNHP